jgi:CubicO group peptidase (beta-lactamase class C family)
VGLSEAGTVVYARGFGLADIAIGEEIGPDTVIEIGSISKQFTAAAVLLLVEEGRVSLDDDIHVYVPELRDYAEPVLIRDLMWMESGLPDYLNSDLMTGRGHAFDEQATAEDVLAAVASVETLDFPPGKRHAYSNTNYFLLRLVVERVTGDSLADVARVRIFEPLGMTRTSFEDETHEPIAGAAIPYVVDANFELTVVPQPWDNQGAGGVYSTVFDLLRWAENFRTGAVGGSTFLRRQLEDGRQLVPLGGSSGRYAAGLVLSAYRGKSLVWHTGAHRGILTALVLEPDRRRAAAVLCNTATVGSTFALAVNALDAWFGP